MNEKVQEAWDALLEALVADSYEVTSNTGIGTTTRADFMGSRMEHTPDGSVHIALIATRMADVFLKEVDET